MSESAPQPPQAPSTLPSDRLITPQTMIALAAMAIVAVIVGKVLWNGNEQLQGQVLVIASGSMGTLLAFYFGSSKGSADKDAKPSPPPIAPIVVAAPVPPPPAVTIGTVNNEAAPPPSNQGPTP